VSAKLAGEHSQLAQELAEAVRRGEEASSRARHLEKQVANSEVRAEEAGATLNALMAIQTEFMNTYSGQQITCSMPCQAQQPGILMTVEKGCKCFST